MKNQLLIATLLFSGVSFAQTNTFPTTGSAGIGTITPNSGFQLQVHGTATYTSPQTQYLDFAGEGAILETVPGTAQGYTGRIGLTNTSCGATGNDGTILRQSGINSVIQNLEGISGGTLTLQSNRALITLDGWYNRVNIGNQTSVSGTTGAALNISQKYDNGLSIQTTTSGKYGLKLKVLTNSDFAFQSYGASTTIPTFSLYGSGRTDIYYNNTNATDKVFLISNSTRKLLQLSNDGILRAREIIVDAINWPDYVFASNYNLMTLDSLEQYILLNKHLPNVKPASQVEAEGMNLNETNKVLMEKVEELTLYLFQINSQLKEQETLLEQQSELLKQQQENLRLQKMLIDELQKPTVTKP